MNIVVAPDSYKGSLSAREVGLTIQKAFLEELQDATVEVVPMADGGEGTLEALLYATDGTRIQAEATGPLGEPIEAVYGILGDGETAVIEMAKVAGLPMVPKEKRNPLKTTTYGVGELILDAIERGFRKILIGLGGSATNDGGLGMLQALGATFLDGNGRHVQPVGASLPEIRTVDFSTIDPRIKECTITAACDVNNPLCGPRGASYVYGRQKGGTEEQIRYLDQGLAHYATLIEKHLSRTIQNMPGAGAAGGLGFALMAIGAKIESGAKVVAEAARLEDRIQTADLVITGEGQSDEQTLYGKVPAFVAQLARKHGVKTILISGSLGKGFEKLYDLFLSCHSIAPGPISLDNAIQHAETYLYHASKNMARLVKNWKDRQPRFHG